MQVFSPPTPNHRTPNTASTGKDESKADPTVASPAPPGLLSGCFQQLYYSEDHIVCLFKKPNNYSEPLIFHIKLPLSGSQQAHEEGRSLLRAGLRSPQHPRPIQEDGQPQSRGSGSCPRPEPRLLRVTTTQGQTQETSSVRYVSIHVAGRKGTLKQLRQRPADSNAKMRARRKGLRERDPINHFYNNKANRSVCSFPQTQAGKDAAVSLRQTTPSSSTRDACNARQPDRREETV